MAATGVTDALQLGDSVTLKLAEGHTLSGVVYAVDPEQGHVVLISGGHGAALACQVVFSHAVVAVDQQTAATEAAWALVDRFTAALSVDGGGAADPAAPRDDSPAWAARRDTVVSHLQRHGLPAVFVPATLALEILGTVTISPPYTAATCASANTVVLARTRQLMDALPA